MDPVTDAIYIYMYIYTVLYMNIDIVLYGIVHWCKHVVCRYNVFNICGKHGTMLYADIVH